MTSYELMQHILSCDDSLKRYNVALYNDVTAQRSIGVQLAKLRPNTPLRFKIRLASPANKITSLMEDVEAINQLSGTIRTVEIDGYRYTSDITIDQFTDEGVKERQQYVTQRVTMVVYKQKKEEV